MLGNTSTYYTGIYNISLLIARVPYYVVITFSSIIFSIISNLLSKGKREEAKKQIVKMIKPSSIFVLPLILTISTLSKYIISIAFGQDYSLAINVSVIQ